MKNKMREILFRGKSTRINSWQYGLPYSSWHDGIIDQIVIDEYHEDVYPETVSQFTGLTDKNGVKIFENDKVVLRGHECVVTYRNNYCDFTFEKIKYGGRSLNVTKANITKYDLEIIGNIHD